MVLLVVAILIDPALYRRWSRAIYFGLTGVMGFVLVFGAATRGSRRWIDIGFFTFQPSEFGKVMLTLCLAAFLADRAKQVDRAGTPLKTIGLAAGPILLVFVQPDIGTALVYIAVLAAVLFVSGVRWAHLALIGTVALTVILAVLWWLPAAGVNVLKPYQAAAAHELHPPLERSERSDLVQPDPVEDRGRRGRPARPRCRRRHPDPARLPAGARDRLRVRLARRAARLLRRARSCSSSTCSSSGAASRSSPAPATSSARSSPPASSSRSCSRCS